MKTVFLLIALGFAVFVAVHRERIYLRDPLGVVYEDGVKQEGSQVYINYSNDVLVQFGTGLHIEEYLVQNWNGIPGVPVELRCLQGLVCLSQADHAPTAPLPGASRAQMSNREITFIDSEKVSVRVTLR